MQRTLQPIEEIRGDHFPLTYRHASILVIVLISTSCASPVATSAQCFSEESLSLLHIHQPRAHVLQVLGTPLRVHKIKDVDDVEQWEYECTCPTSKKVLRVFIRTGDEFSRYLSGAVNRLQNANVTNLLPSIYETETDALKFPHTNSTAIQSFARLSAALNKHDGWVLSWEVVE